MRISSQRPPDRRESSEIDERCAVATLMPDATQLPAFCHAAVADLSASGAPIAFEIKVDLATRQRLDNSYRSSPP